MKVVWSQEAIANLHEIERYIALDKRMASDRVGTTLETFVRGLGRFPRLGRRRSARVREAVEPRYRYIVRYTLLPNEEAPDTVVVLKLKHPKQQR